jgi:hypothetical protein
LPAACRNQRRSNESPPSTGLNIDNFARDIAWDLHKGKKELISNLRKDKADLAREIWAKHENALTSYEAVHYLSFELVSELHQHYWTRIGDTGGDLGCEVGFLIAGRGSTIAAEILHLVSGGFADGAAARQRTLHELTVVLELLTTHCDTDLAERYMDYATIEQFEDMQTYQEHAESIGQQPFTDREYRELEAEYSAILERRGQRFRKRNQWAAILFDPLPKDVTFDQLEKKAGVQHFKPFVRNANHQVHAGPRSALLNMRHRPHRREVSIGVGASSFVDFAEVAHLALRNILHISSCVHILVDRHTEDVDPDLVVGLKCLERMVGDAGVAMSRSQQRA